jgi:hypothetical protein
VAVLLKDLEVTWRIILKTVMMKFDANMCMHRIYVPPNKDQLKPFVESVIKLNVSKQHDIPGQLMACCVAEGIRHHRILGFRTSLFMKYKLL